MNSNSGRVLRSNARRRTPLSNSLRQDHNRSTTELYSPRDAPTSHTTRYDAATSATGAHDALQRARAVGGDAAPNAPAATTSARLTRIASHDRTDDRSYVMGARSRHSCARAHAHAATPARAHMRHATHPTAPRTHAMPHTTHAHAQPRTHTSWVYFLQ